MIYDEKLKEVLPAEEETYLLRKYNETKDIDIRNILVEHNLRLVIYVINKYFNSYKEFEDLFIIGSIGLIKAIEKYDINTNNKFSSYAVKSIINSIYYYYRKKETSLSLNTECFIDDNKEYIDLLESKDNLSVVFNKILIKDLINELTEKEKDILLSYYGALGYTRCTQKELGIKYNVSSQYIQLIIIGSINKIQKKYNNKYKLSIYNMFREYTKEEINESLKLLTKDELYRLRSINIRELTINGREKELYLRIKSLIK